MDALLVLLAFGLAEGAPTQETPEEAFRKIEAAIEGARSVRVKFTIDATAKDVVPGNGSFTIEEGNRSSLSTELKSKDGGRIAVRMDCDGSKVRSAINEHQVEAAFDQKYGRSNFNMYLCRLGIFTGMFAMHGMLARVAQREQAVSVDLKQLFQARNFEFSGDGKGGSKILTYELKAAVEPMPIGRVKIWYDPGTYKIRGREYRIKGKRSEETIIEEYTDLQFGDEKAADVPREKPAAPPPVSDAEMEDLFFKAKLTAAETHFKAGRKDKAAGILEEIISTYPKHPRIPDARRLLEDAKKK